MKKIVQITAWPEGYEAVFFSYNNKEFFSEPVFCWALVSERPYVENGEEEEKTYIEGQVMAGNGGGITGVFDFPQCATVRKLHGDIVFMDYQNTRLPEKCRREQREYLKKVAEELMELRRSDHIPTIEPGVPEDDPNDDPPEPESGQASPHSYRGRIKGSHRRSQVISSAGR